MDNKQFFFDWNSFTPEAAQAALPGVIAKAESAVAEIENGPVSSYEDLVWRLDDATRDLWRIWGGVSHMLNVMNSAGWREVQEKFQGDVVAFSLRTGQSEKLYLAARKLLDGDSVTGNARRRILEKTAESAQLAGVALEGEAKKRFNEIKTRLARLASDFTNAVIDDTPAEISDAAYLEAMKHEPDRAKRERLFRMRQTRAPSNAARIEEILRLKQEEAEILGFADYAGKSLKTKSAGTPAAAMAMIDKLDEATLQGALEEERELKSAATTPLEPWDRAWEAERLREAKYDYSENELKKHFELETTLAGLFRLCNAVFGIEVKETAASEKPPVWHEDVRVFSVAENGETVAYFYFDPFTRTNLKSCGAWMNEFSNRCDRRGEKPVAAIIMNLPGKDADGKCFMPFRDVETVFHEFGHALQCMLTRVGEEDAAGINLVEWDAVETASQFMENWCLDERTGIEIPPELKNKVRAAKNFRAASMCRRQLALAKTDLLLHLSGRTQDPNSLKNSVFAHFGVPLLPEDRFLDAFTHIFAGGYSAGYYSYKWAEVMSADCYGAFEEASRLGEDAVKAAGRRYRETILALGGSMSALEVFRLFRGRDPQIDALLSQQGLLPRN